MAKGQVRIAIVGDSSQFKKELDGVEGKLSGFGDKLKGFGAGLIAGFGGREIAGFANSAIQGAADIGESLSKNAVVFKEGADQITAAAKEAATTVGLSEKDYLALSGTVGVLGKAAGLTGDQLGDFGNEVLQRAADIGSFNNAATPDVVEAWGAAMRGEMEPMRKFGVLLDDATLRQKALDMGLISSVKNALTPQQKALAANALIMEQTKDAAGDFARTSDGLANKQRILKAQLDNVKTAIGAKLLPVFSKFVGFLSSNVGPAFDKVMSAFGAIRDAFVARESDFGADGWLGAMHKIGGAIGAVVDWVKAHWPTIQAVMQAVLERIGQFFGWWYGTVIPALIAALQSAVNWVVANWPKFQEAFMAVFNWIKDNVVPIVAEVISFLVTEFGKMVDWVKENWPAISEAIGHVMEAIKDVISTVVGWAVKFWQTFGEDITAYAKNAWDTIKGVISAAMDAVRGIIMTVVNLINGDWGKAWDSFKGVLSAAWDAIKTMLRGAVDAVGIILGAAWKPIQWALDEAWSYIQGIWNGVVGWISGLPNRIAGAASGMWDGIKNSFRSAINWIIQKWNNLDFTVGGGSFMGVDFPSFTLGTPNIPMLADGGIVTSPTLAMIGERGPEAVVPLRNSSGGGPMGNVYNVTFQGVVDQNSARVVMDAIRVHERTNGTSWRSAA